MRAGPRFIPGELSPLRRHRLITSRLATLAVLPAKVGRAYHSLDFLIAGTALLTACGVDGRNAPETVAGRPPILVMPPFGYSTPATHSRRTWARARGKRCWASEGKGGVRVEVRARARK